MLSNIFNRGPEKTPEIVETPKTLAELVAERDVLAEKIDTMISDAGIKTGLLGLEGRSPEKKKELSEEVARLNSDIEYSNVKLKKIVEQINARPDSAQKVKRPNPLSYDENSDLNKLDARRG